MEEDDISRILSNMELRYGQAVLRKASVHKDLRNYYVSKYMYGQNPEKNPNYGDRTKATDTQKTIIGVNMWRYYHGYGIKGREKKQ